jgi:hypothetical protein
VCMRKTLNVPLIPSNLYTFLYVQDLYARLPEYRNAPVIEVVTALSSSIPISLTALIADYVRPSTLESVEILEHMVTEVALLPIHPHT